MRTVTDEACKYRRTYFPVPYLAFLTALGAFCGSIVSVQDATGWVTGVIYQVLNRERWIRSR